MQTTFTCKYCLETCEDDFTDYEYPEVCPNCRTTLCDECGEILKADSIYCYHCGEIDPDFNSLLVRTSSTSAAYASENWVRRVKKWHNYFGDEKDPDHRYEIWHDMEGNQTIREITFEDGGRKVLNERELTEEEIEKLH